MRLSQNKASHKLIENSVDIEMGNFTRNYSHCSI
jgi:hypothetical protein